MVNFSYEPVLVNVNLSFSKYEEDYNSESGEELCSESYGDQTFQVTLIHPREVELLDAMAYNFAEMAGLDSDYYVEYNLPAHNLTFNDSSLFIKWFNDSITTKLNLQGQENLCSSSSTL